MKKLYSVLFALVWLMPSLSMMAQTFHGTRDDFRDETIYFAMTTRFYDGDPKNNVLSWDKQDVQIANNDPDWRGDFAGLIEKLDYIKALGFTAIWITPVTQNASGEDYHGYHSMDFSSVDLRYESRTAWGCDKDVKFQDLIDAAHKKGMKIILDIVLNHTSNFGEVNLNPLFTRNQNIRNQATPAGALIPNTERLSANYFDQTGQAQYQERFKFFKNPQYDKHNMYHHYGTGWNWDLPNRWWGQIAGDCVDLNTENDAVAQYLVDCYGKFIEMGVDGFRIDTTGHIARLTFNTQFIPQFTALFEKYKDKRADGSAYLMFGECCARFGGVIYRDQHNLSSHFYTWKSEQSLINSFKSQSSQSWWDTQVLNEGHDTPVGPMKVCESETAFGKNSSNVFMQNGSWHQPDYSQYSGFSVIDFPMHYNFNDAGSAINIAKQGDHYYNDASYNVVYVDSHDYCPGPNDGTRFNGGTAQWAENLSLMFTFRGIPCIYYGSEVEFMKGKPIDVGGENNKTPRKESGRAYFGHYLEGNVTATDFGVYTANGNVNTTLNGDLAHHIRMLNKIRAAVPALRKGQYTFDGCSGNIAFKRAYNKNGEDSYALVAINGGATFTNVPSGTYVDIVTGQSYTPSNGTITVNAPSNKGQLRVLVKNWKGGRVAEDGKFMYTNSAVAKGGNPSFTDPGTKQYYTANDVVGNASVKFNPAGGSFKTETLTVTASLNEVAKSGWYKVGNGEQVNLTPGQSSSFTIGKDMSYGQSVQVSWGANDGQETYTGTLTYKKVDPNAVITIFVKADKAPNLYAWNSSQEFNGAWPGKPMTDKQEVNGESFWYQDFDTETLNIIFNSSGGQTGNIEGITETKFFTYDGGTGYTEIDMDYVAPAAKPAVTLNPNGGKFKTETLSITANLNTTATSGWYKIGNGSQVSLTKGKATTFTIGENMKPGEEITVSWSASDGKDTQTGSATYTKAEPSSGITIYITANQAPYLYAWTGTDTALNGGWPGNKLTDTQVVEGVKYYYKNFDAQSVNIVINNGNGGQTSDIKNITADAYFSYDGNTGYKTISNPGAGGDVEDPSTPETPSGEFVVYFNNDQGWNEPWIHYWGGESSTEWPGVAMKKYEGNVWYMDLPKGTTGIIFHPDDNANWQTNDLTPVHNHIYSFKGDHKGSDDGEYKGGGSQGGGDTEDPGVTDPVEPVNGFKVYFDNSKSNWNTVNVHYWGGESSTDWPGVAMTLNNDGLWEYTVPNGTTGLVFNAGKDMPQTKDLDAKPNHIYDVDGDTDKTSGVDSVDAESKQAQIWGANGKIYIDTPEDMEIIVVRIDGRFHREFMKAGRNVIEGLPRGLYIVNGVKVMI